MSRATLPRTCPQCGAEFTTFGPDARECPRGHRWTIAELEEYEASVAEDERLGGPAAPWGALGKLPPARPPVPDLPERFLPEPLRPWLVDGTARLSVPLALMAAPAIVALSTVVGRTIGILPKRHDDWLVVPNLWGAVVARPGFLKTACAQEAHRPLRRLVASAQEQFAATSAAAEAERAILELRIAALKEQAKAAAKEQSAAAGTGVAGRAPRSAKPLEVFQAELQALQAELRSASPTERRYYTQDATVEKLGELLRENPRGIEVLRDELSGWLRTLDKPGREGDREFFLEAWNGTGDYTYDRIERGTIHIPTLTLSLFGAIQPGKAAAYIQDALALQANDDGLLQRLQVLVWPDSLGDWRNVDHWPDADARQRAYQVFRALDELDPAAIGIPDDDDGRIPALHFAADAQELFDAWRDALERRLRSVELESAPAFESHLAKYRSLMPSLALLFHLVDIVDGGEPGPVPLHAARRAAEWGDFLEQHARKVYAAELCGPEMAAGALAEKIRAGEVADGMPLREIYRKHWRGLATSDQVAAAGDVLRTAGWCRLETVETDGRPSVVLRLHPQLQEQEP